MSRTLPIAVAALLLAPSLAVAQADPQPGAAQRLLQWQFDSIRREPPPPPLRGADADRMVQGAMPRSAPAARGMSRSGSPGPSAMPSASSVSSPTGR